MNIRSLSSGTALAGLLALSLVGATPAAAAVTYHYSGGPSPTNTRDGGVVSYIDLHAPITFDFTVASALAANLTGVDIKASVLSWVASGGKPQSTAASSDIGAFLSRLVLSTDASGNIFNWNIPGSSHTAALPGLEMGFYFDGISGPHEALAWYDSASGRTLGGAVSHSDIGTFTRLGGSAGGVPEPTTWALMVMGFGAVGLSLRRRRTALAA